MTLPALVIAIPAYDEAHLPHTLQSLLQCEIPRVDILVLVCINYGQSSPQAIKQGAELQYTQLSKAFENDVANRLQFKFLLEELPDKDAGVGLARKVMVDYCQQRYGAAGAAIPIVSLDADCTVASNYISAVYAHFLNNPATPGSSIYFEHVLAEAEHPEAIAMYELFMRYYVQGLRNAGYPWAYHTVGSAMAVRLGVYAKLGGMNKRKAGEDFYLLNKVIPVGGFTEINTTVVFPASRKSDRVPFGTGRAMLEWEKDPQKLKQVYHPGIFGDLKLVMDAIHSASARQADLELNPEWPTHLAQSLEIMGFWDKYHNACDNSSGHASRYIRLWRSLDLFFVRKWVHCLRDIHWGLMDIERAAAEQLKQNEIFIELKTELLLSAYRSVQKEANWSNSKG